MAGLPGFDGEALPVAAGKLQGMRTFDVDFREGTLHGMAFKDPWSNSENVAECKDDQNKDKAHSMKDCEHGFWSYFGVNSRYMREDRAQAIIEGYGEVIVGEEGFRAEKAIIKAITVPQIKDAVHYMQLGAREDKSQSIFTLLWGLVAIVFGTSAVSTAIFFNVRPDMPLIGNIVIKAVILVFALFFLSLGLIALLASKDYRQDSKRVQQEVKEFTNGEKVNWTLYQKEFEAKVQEKYPGAVLYSSVKEMLHDHKDNILLHGILFSA